MKIKTILAMVLLLFCGGLFCVIFRADILGPWHRSRKVEDIFKFDYMDSQYTNSKRSVDNDTCTFLGRYIATESDFMRLVTDLSLKNAEYNSVDGRYSLDFSSPEELGEADEEWMVPGFYDQAHSGNLYYKTIRDAFITCYFDGEFLYIGAYGKTKALRVILESNQETWVDPSDWVYPLKRTKGSG